MQNTPFGIGLAASVLPIEFALAVVANAPTDRRPTYLEVATHHKDIVFCIVLVSLWGFFGVYVS